MKQGLSSSLFTKDVGNVFKWLRLEVKGLWGVVWEWVGNGVVMGLWGGGVVWEWVGNGVVGWWCGRRLVMRLWGGGVVWE